MNGWRGFALFSARLWNCGLRRRRIRLAPAPGSSTTQSRLLLRRSTPRPSPLTTITARSRDNSLAVAAPGVLANDSDANGDALTVRLDRNAAHGTLTLQPNGSFSYTPTSGFTGTDDIHLRRERRKDAIAPSPR